MDGRDFIHRTDRGNSDDIEGHLQMDRLQMLREAIRELGRVSDSDLATFILQRYGVRVEARFIPIWKASLRGLEALEKSRDEAKAERVDRAASDRVSVPAVWHSQSERP